MKLMRRIGIGLLTVFLLALAGLAYLSAYPPALLSERAIRAHLTTQLSKWTGALVSIRGDIRLNYFPRLTLDIEDIHLADIQRMPALRDIRAKSAVIRLELWPFLSGTPVVERLTLIAPKIESAATGAPAAGHVAQAQAPAFVNALQAAPFEEVYVENGTVTVTGPQTAETFNEFSARIFFNAGDGSQSSRINFRWRDQPVELGLSTGAPETTASGAKMPVDIRIGGGLIEADIDGEAAISDTMRMTGSLDLSIADVPQFANWMGVMIPDAAKAITFAAEGPFHWQGYKIGFDDGTFSIDGNRALGALAIAFNGARPQVEGTLALQRVNISEYIGLESPPVQPAEAAKALRDRTVELDFPVLHHVDVDLRVSTTEFAAGPVSLGQTALSFSILSGRLTADFLVLDLCGGNGSGRLDVNAAVPASRIKLRASLTDLSARSCIELFAPRSPLGGTTDLTADLTTKGRTAKALLQQLGGKITTTVTGGQADIDIAKLVAQARNGPITGWQSVRGQTTPFETLNGEFIFRHGSAYSDSLEAISGGMKIAGEGTVDLPSRKLDMRVTVASETPETSPSVQQLIADLAGALVIQGPWSGPKIMLEPMTSSQDSDSPQGEEARQQRLHTWLSPGLLSSAGALH